MALTMTEEVRVTATNVESYINIDSITINKRGGNTTVSCIVRHYASEGIRLADGQSFDTGKYRTDYVVGGDCPYVQIYTYLKSLNKFSTATDLL